MRLHAVAPILLCQAASLAAAPAPRSQLMRDVEGTAIAACLAGQRDAALRRQGDAWADVIVQRGHGNSQALKDVRQAVGKALADGGMAVAHVDGPVPTDLPLPLLYCYEIVNRPGVRLAIGRAMAALAPAYRGR